MIRKLFRVYNDLHFRGKMILSFFLFGFIPLLFASIFQLNVVIQALQDELERTAAAQLDEMAHRIEERINLYNQVANSLVYDTRLSMYLSQPYENMGDTIEFYHYTWNQASNIIKNNSDIMFVTIYTSNPGLVSSPPYIVRVNRLEDLDEYDDMKIALVMPHLGGLRNVIQRGDYWLKPFDGGKPAISLNRVLPHENMMLRPNGIVTLVISTDALFKLIENTSEHSVNFLVDNHGYIITATDTSWNGVSVSSLIPQETWNSASADEAYVINGDEDQRILLRALRGGWMLGTHISMRDALAPVRNMRYASVAVLLLGAVASISLVSVVSVVTARRFKLLLEKMNSFRLGLTEQSLPIGGRDEIGLLDDGFHNMTNTLDKTINELYQVTFEKREAQLLALQSRINPHFLYNTLSSIGWMTQTHKPWQVREAIETLAAYYRTSLSSGRDVITIREELDGLRSYLSIRNLCGGGRIRAVISVDTALDELMLPKMTLQPIVENCIEHGISAEHPSVSIIISSSVERGDALIHISDDGAGIDGETLERINAGTFYSQSGGYGIRNVQMRLKLYFGENYGLCVKNQPECGVCVTVRIPLPMD